MKNLKQILLTGALVFSLVSMGVNAADPPKQHVRSYMMSFDKAMQNMTLVATMHQQLNPDFLNTFQLVYTKKIVYKNYVILISGTRQQWQMFFWPQGTMSPKFRNIKLNIN